MQKIEILPLPPHARCMCTDDTPGSRGFVNCGPGQLGIEHHHPLPAPTPDGDDMLAHFILLSPGTGIELTGSGSIILLSLDDEGTTVIVETKLSH
jgi:hypothetical protein